MQVVDLLYNAYNRDDSEVYGIEKAIEAGYDEIYIDAENEVTTNYTINFYAAVKDAFGNY